MKTKNIIGHYVTSFFYFLCSLFLEVALKTLQNQPKNQHGIQQVI